MLSSLLSVLKSDALLLGSVTLFALFVTYMTVMRIHVFLYTQKHEKRPIHYKVFRLYNKSMITNCPSKSEKKFYAKTNKLTYFFNSVMIFSFVVFVYVYMR